MQLQGTTHLNFTVFAMKQLDPSMPSLSTIKKTFLPGYTPPTKVALQWHACMFVCIFAHAYDAHACLAVFAIFSATRKKVFHSMSIFQQPYSRTAWQIRLFHPL